MNAEQLAQEWLSAKKAEETAAARRLEIEQDILRALPAKEEGSKTTMLANGIKICTIGKLKYSADLEKLLSITQAWPVDAKPIKTKVEADETALKQIRAERPDLWRQLAPAVTVRAAKTNVSIEEPTHGV